MQPTKKIKKSLKPAAYIIHVGKPQIFKCINAAAGTLCPGNSDLAKCWGRTKPAVVK